MKIKKLLEKVVSYKYFLVPQQSISKRSQKMKLVLKEPVSKDIIFIQVFVYSIQHCSPLSRTPPLQLVGIILVILRKCLLLG